VEAGIVPGQHLPPHLLDRLLGHVAEASDSRTGDRLVFQLTPDAADALADRFFALLQELRVPAPTSGADGALVSITVLPWLEPS
jgi:hypothetical protein